VRLAAEDVLHDDLEQHLAACSPQEYLGELEAELMER